MSAAEPITFKKLARTRRTMREADDDEIESFIAEQGIPTLEEPAAPAEPPSPPPPSAAAPARATVPENTSLPGTGQAATAPPPRTAVTRLNIEVSRHVKRQLVDKAAHMECTVRYLVMDALRAAGYRLHQDDLLPDGRAPARRGEQPDDDR